jgi:hypothetical protein
MSGRTFLAVLAGIGCFILVYGIEVALAWLVRGHFTEKFTFEIVLGFPALFFSILAGVKVYGNGYREKSQG